MSAYVLVFTSVVELKLNMITPVLSPDHMRQVYAAESKGLYTPSLKWTRQKVNRSMVPSWMWKSLLVSTRMENDHDGDIYLYNYKRVTKFFHQNYSLALEWRREFLFVGCLFFYALTLLFESSLHNIFLTQTNTKVSISFKAEAWKAQTSEHNSEGVCEHRKWVFCMLTLAWTRQYNNAEFVGLIRELWEMTCKAC